MTLWVTGARGLLGSAVVLAAEAARLDLRATDRDLDVCDAAAVRGFVRAERPTAVIHCAAFTDVDGAEGAPEHARRLNVDGAAHVAEAAHTTGARLIHLSTNYVFDGQAEEPYEPSMPIAPLSVYGRTKAESEARVHALCPEALIVRTAGLYAPTHSSFASKVLARLNNTGSAMVVTDQSINPTYAEDLAAALIALIRAPLSTPRVQHITGEGACSWYAFASALCAGALVRGLAPEGARVHRTTSAALGAAAARPANGALARPDATATPEALLPPWQDGLRRHLDALAARHASHLETP